VVPINNNDIPEIKINLSGAGLRIGIVMSRFKKKASKGLLDACISELVKQKVQRADILLTTVPGALEISLALQKMATTGQFNALIALGAVIRGDTYHFEVVSNESASGVTAVQLKTGIPIANGIITVETDEQALSRMNQKGTEAARVAIEMVNLLRELDKKIP